MISIISKCAVNIMISMDINFKQQVETNLVLGLAVEESDGD
jgi:hypothetical protein